jgi:hypothetical protein
MKSLDHYVIYLYLIFLAKGSKMKNIEIKEEVKFNSSNTAKQPFELKVEVEEVKGGQEYEEEYKGNTH